MIEAAINFASRSPHKRFKTGAAIYIKDKLIAAGWAHTPGERLSLYSRHAEAHALMRGHHEDLHGATCFIATLSRHNNLTNAQPCVDCIRALQVAGITRVCYTTADGVRELDLTQPVVAATFKQYKLRAA